jgi:hypothetical protein
MELEDVLADDVTVGRPQRFVKSKKRKRDRNKIKTKTLALKVNLVKP